jgi:hypothetical protein
MKSFQKHIDFVRRQRAAVFASDPTTCSLLYRPFAKTFTDEERQHLSGFILDASTPTPTTFTSRNAFTAFVKPAASQRNAV